MARKSQEQIKEEYEEFRDEISEHEAEITIIRARMGVLRAMCKHPNKYTYSAMGELGIKCPDCGYAT